MRKTLFKCYVTQWGGGEMSHLPENTRRCTIQCTCVISVMKGWWVSIFQIVTLERPGRTPSSQSYFDQSTLQKQQSCYTH